jgi:hypothetical protein
MADAAEIWITEDVWRYPGVEALLEPYPAERHTAEFRGIEQPITVLSVGSRNEAAAEQKSSQMAGEPIPDAAREEVRPTT